MIYAPTKHESGYILVTSLVSVAILGILGSALVSLALTELKRVKQEEERSRHRSLLQAAVTLAASELTKEPDARLHRFDDAQDQISIGTDTFDLKLQWESEKIDLNTADLDLIDTKAQEFGIDRSVISELISQLETYRNDNESLRLLGDLDFSAPQALECLREIFTVFGGRRFNSETISLDGVFPRPTPGTRLSIFLSQSGTNTIGHAVILMTGDPVDPHRVMDWRWIEALPQASCI